MQFFYGLVFVMAIGMAIFSVQNSNAAPVIVKFLLWRFETSPVYTILGSIVLGILFGFQGHYGHRFGQKGQITRSLQPDHRL